MDILTMQTVISYLESNKDEVTEIILDSGKIYTTKYMKQLDGMLYITTDHHENGDIAIIPVESVHHVVVKNAGMDKMIGFRQAKIS
ncbi:MAG: hypothetical protein GY858_09110 [Candidatus Omnitrophica bacterium]|nr:hypothetical protein [Candidatus Omnitrophota bacterium]